MDVWVKRTADNYKKIDRAFHTFGMPVFDMTEKIFLSDEYDVWMFGVEPVKIELLTAVKGLRFDEAYPLSEIHQEDDLPVRFLHINSLIASKKAAGRYKDLDDIDQLKRKKKE